MAPPFRGHLDPMRALAGELVRRGHRATFLLQAEALPLVATGDADGRLDAVALGAASHPPGHLAGVLGRMARADNPLVLRGVIRDVAAATDMLAREAPAACRALGIEAIVVDQTEAAGGLVARHLGLPHVSVANALPLDREPAIPPPFTGWRYDPSPWGLERNKGGYRVSDRLMAPQARVIARHAAAWGLGDLRTIEDCASPHAVLSQLVAGLDFPRAALPAHFHYVGPLRAPAAASAFRLPDAGGRARAYASLGTLQGGRARLFGRIAGTAAAHGLHLVLAHGGRLDATAVARLPGRPAVYDFVPQAVVLDGARVAILNGGLNTVMDALAAGVPIVAVPIAFEQGAIAARLERAGAGLRAGGGLWAALTGRGLSRAIGRVLDEPGFTEAARALAAEIAAAGGVRRAADIVERVARTGQAVMRGDLVADPAYAGSTRSPPPCGEELEVGVVPDEAIRCLLPDPHPALLPGTSPGIGPPSPQGGRQIESRTCENDSRETDAARRRA